ncbi:MAG: hypothetical protein LBQ62_10550 [Candidatus Accumulibacter sp.]|nr:hypothetical protein [Accumulibacter sp.]
MQTGVARCGKFFASSTAASSRTWGGESVTAVVDTTHAARVDSGLGVIGLFKAIAGNRHDAILHRFKLSGSRACGLATGGSETTGVRANSPAGRIPGSGNKKPALEKSGGLS